MHRASLACLILQVTTVAEQPVTLPTAIYLGVFMPLAQSCRLAVLFA